MSHVKYHAYKRCFIQIQYYSYLSEEVVMSQRLIQAKQPYLWLLIIFTASFFTPFSLSAQQDSLTVDFNSIYIQDKSFRELPAGFPNPVLSLITVKDQNNRYVHGLADTSRWLTPTDTTELGVLVDSVWQNILEYHRDDSTLPPNPDVKQTSPEYIVTELFDVEGFGLSLALAMDYSGSLGDDIYISEDAARIFVRQMSQNDRAAIIKFTGKVNVFQEFTGDTTLLMEAIAEPPSSREYTALYDAIYTGITMCLEESGRRAVIAYTDGIDNYSSHSIDDVIAYAKVNNMPVFMIGLGTEIENDELERIATETGGVYLYADSVEELAEIYISIYGLIRGFYVLAHSSPDPFNNGTGEESILQ